MTAIPVTIQERIPLPPSIPARTAAATGAVGLTPAEILRILRQRMFMILTLWILATAGAIGVTWYLDKHMATYQAKGYVQVESPFPRRPMEMIDPGVSGELMNRYVADQAVIMKDDRVLQSVLTNSDVTGTQWYGAQPDKSLILDHLRDEIVVTPNSGTSYLTVLFSARSPEDSAIMVNTLINKYVEHVQERSQVEAKSELQDYRDKETELTGQLVKLLDDKKKFMSEANAPGMAKGVDVVGETLRALSSAVITLEQEMLQYKALYENLRGTEASQIVLSPEMNMMIQQDPRINTLLNSKSMLEQQKTIALQQFGPKHRAVKQLQDSIDAIDQDLQKVTLQKEKEVRDYQIDSANTHYRNAMQAKLQLEERKFEQEAKQRDTDQAMVQFQGLEDRQLQLTKELDKIREFSNQLTLMIKERGMVRVRPIPAIKPTSKSFPQWSLMVPGGSVLGLILGIGLALLLELMDTTMRTPRDIIRYAHVPILGTVPDLDDEEIPIDKIELASHSAPRSMTAESFRNIRTNLLLSSPAERQRTVLVTSARPEEGKTAIACNLAISIGQSGRRVLLIDANFHRPVLHQMFNRPQREGLSNALIGQAKLDTLIQQTDLPNVDIITSGPIPPNPTELLAGHYLRDLIAEAATRYDQIIFDGPPILLLSDSLVLAGTLDGVIIVCRAKTTSRGAVQRAREQIERVNGRIFGAILNAARVSRGGYFREQIRSYYDYQPEEVLAGQSSKALPQGGRTNADDDRNS